MGADGGLSWMRVIDASKESRIYELIEPFSIINTYFRDEDYEWLDSHKKPYDHYIISRYGTDIEDDGLEILRDLINHESNYDELTFEEFILEIYTRPSWQNDYIQFWQREVIERSFYKVRTGKYEQDIKLFDQIKDMKIFDWKKELLTYIDINSLLSEETWT
jgi:hypothetical protein